MARPKSKPKAANTTTLHDYFSKAQEVSKKKKSLPTKTKAKPAPSEIIVIDSDEEEQDKQPPTTRRSSGKRKISEVDFMEASTSKRRVSIPPTVPFGKPVFLLTSPPRPLVESTSSGHTVSFGRPNHLLGGEPSTSTHSVSAKPPEPEPEVLVIEDDNDWATGDDEVELVAPCDGDDIEILDDEDLIKTETENVKRPPSRRRSTAPPAEKIRADIQPQAAPLSTKSANGNLFSVLMSSHAENEAWKEASAMEDRSSRPKGRRGAPFYKVLQGMPIAVDAFKYGAIPCITAYFLTHAHSDHYTNLSSSWSNGPIYCSEGTANLIMHMLKVDKKWVHPLPMDVPTIIPNTNGVKVTLIEANHCPGSSLFFFEGPQTVNAGDSTYKSSFVGSPRTFRYLHCGDFRASPQHVLHPAVKGKRIDHVYLDTTYLDPKYTFPPQPLVISACAELAKRISNGSLDKGDANGSGATMAAWLKTSPSEGKGKQKPGRILMVVGTYSIGKERIVKAMAHALNTKVYCDSRKAAILRCQCDPDLHALLTSKPLEAQIHLVPLMTVTSDKLKDYVDRFKGHFDKAVGFRPTGWTYTQPSGTGQSPTIPAIIERMQKTTFAHTDMSPARNSTAALQLYMVPYSEHSSFSELTCFAMSFQWGKMIATVNVGSEASRGKMAQWVKKWEAERQKKGGDYVVEYRHAEYW